MISAISAFSMFSGLNPFATSKLKTALKVGLASICDKNALALSENDSCRTNSRPKWVKTNLRPSRLTKPR